jgi:hypothetical protein
MTAAHGSMDGGFSMHHFTSWFTLGDATRRV